MQGNIQDWLELDGDSRIQLLTQEETAMVIFLPVPPTLLHLPLMCFKPFLSSRIPEAISPTEKRQAREADHSPQTSVKAKKTWIYTSCTPYVFML
jgi:hypothetical protein